MTWSSALGDIAFLSIFVAGVIALKVATWKAAENEAWSDILDLALQCTIVLQGIFVGALFFLWLIGVLGPAHITMVLLGLCFLIAIFRLQPEIRNQPRK